MVLSVLQKEPFRDTYTTSPFKPLALMCQTWHGWARQAEVQAPQMERLYRGSAGREARLSSSPSVAAGRRIRRIQHGVRLG